MGTHQLIYLPVHALGRRGRTRIRKHRQQHFVVVLLQHFLISYEVIYSTDL